MLKARQIGCLALGVGLLLALYSTPAVASNRSDCESSAPDQVIRGCSNLLKSGKLGRENRAIAHMRRATAYSQTGNQAQAIEDFNQALAIRPNEAAAYHGRGLALARMSRFNEAIADYDQAIVMLPDTADLHFLRGFAHAEAGHLNAAIADFDRTIAIDPEHAAAMTQRGRVYMRSGNTDRAIADFDRAIAIRGPADALYERGLAYLNKGDYRRAIDDLGIAIGMVPGHPDSHYYRGYAHAGAGDVDAALADYNRVIDIHPNHQAVYYVRGLIYLQKGEFDRAIADFDTMIGMNPDHPGAHYSRGLAYLQKGDTEQAARDCATSQRLNPVIACPNDTGAGRWDHSALEQLFPPAPDGWSKGNVQVTELDSTMGGIDSVLPGASNLVTGSDETVGVPVRLRVFQTYQGGEKTIKITIDTEDLDTASLIASAHDNDKVRTQLAGQGLRAENLQGLQALMVSKPQGAAVRVEDLGIVLIECEYADCEADLSTLIKSVDFDRIAQFVSYKHRKQASATSD